LHTNTDDVDLLAIEAATLFALTESGRIQHENAPDRSPGPRLYLARYESSNVVRIRLDVGEETARAICALVADEPQVRDMDSTLRHLDDYVELLASEAPVKERSSGLSYCFPDHLRYEHDLTLVSSDTLEGDRLVADLMAGSAMPQTLVALGFLTAADIWTPWCIALSQGEVASICMTARLGTIGAEAGVITVPAFRGRGFAAAATAGWALLPSLRGRVLFYSTDRTNVSSQRVAARLGLHFIGATLRLT
jgi:hypothetical protein